MPFHSQLLFLVLTRWKHQLHSLLHGEDTEDAPSLAIHLRPESGSPGLFLVVAKHFFNLTFWIINGHWDFFTICITYALGIYFPTLWPSPKNDLFFFPGLYVTNCHTLDGLEQEKHILPQFWRLGVQNPDVGGTRFPLKALKENPPQCLLVANNPWCCSVCRCISVISTSASHDSLPCDGA